MANVKPHIGRVRFYCCLDTLLGLDFKGLDFKWKFFRQTCSAVREVLASF